MILKPVFMLIPISCSSITPSALLSSPSTVYSSPAFNPLVSQPNHYLSAAVASRRSSGLRGICPSDPTSSSDKEVRGQEETEPWRTNYCPALANRGLTDMGRRRRTEREKMTPPNPHLSCYCFIVLARFVSLGTSPPSAPIWQQWLKVIMSEG